MKHLLNVFFQEKQLPNEEWMIKTDDVFYIVDSQTLQKLIVEKLSEEEQLSLWEILQRLDIYNRDVNEFLHHLAKRLVVTHSAEITEIELSFILN